tara:strand:- start:9457 stop:9717 length:261 start_codon:yes stop_codon:yes gene_type:complete
MPRRTRPSGGFIRKKKNRHPVVEELIFSVVASNQDMENAWIEGMYPTFEEAKDMVDNFRQKDIDLYIYSKDNRVLYTKKGVIGGEL